MTAENKQGDVPELQHIALSYMLTDEESVITSSGDR